MATASTEFRRTAADAATNGALARQARRPADHLKEVPQPRALRDRIHAEVARLAGQWNRSLPFSRDDLEKMARGLIAEMNLRESYVGWTMVLLASAFWADQVRRVPHDRRLFLVPPCPDHVADCPVEAGKLGASNHGCAACRVSDYRRLAEALGYRVLPAEGSPAVLGAIVNGDVDAIMGVASLDLLEKAIDTILAAGIPCMAVPLLNGDANNPEADEDWVDDLIRLPYQPAPAATATYVHLMRAAAGLFSSAELERLAPRRHSPPEPEATLAEMNGQILERLDPLAATETIALDFLTKGGKHSRPFITLAVYDALTGGHATLPDGDRRIAQWPDAVKRCALSIEVFHKASLVHDDVEDDDAFRYGDQTLHRKYGVSTAINVGDYLIGLGYRLVSREGKTLGPEVVADILDRIAHAHMRLSDGQGAELIWRDSRHKQLTPADALRIYELKTAPAFEAALYTGMRLAQNDSPYDAAISHFARDLGVAFQIINDLNDWQGDDHNKLSAAGDVLGGRPTVLWALALAGLADEDRARLETLAAQKPLSLENLREIRQLYDAAGVFEKANQLVEAHQEAARKVAAEIEPDRLRRLLDYLLAMVLQRQQHPAGTA